MANELTVRFRIKYVRGDVVWFHPEREESDVTYFTISGEQALINIQTFSELNIKQIDLGDADSAFGYVYLENVNDSGYIDIVEEASGSYVIARLYPGDSVFMQRGNESPTFGVATEAGNLDLLVIAVDN